MVLNTCEMWSKSIKIAFFPKNSKNRPATGGFISRFPSVMRLSKLVYLHKSPNLDIFICNFCFKPSPFEKLSVKCQTRPLGLLIFHSAISLSHKKFPFENFWWLHCMWFLVCPPPPIKNPGYAYARKMAFPAVSPPNHYSCSPSESKLL